MWSFDKVREKRYIDHVYNENEEDQDVDPADVLNHPVENTDDPLLVPDYVESLDDQMPQGSLHEMYVPHLSQVVFRLTHHCC